jgi:hypothetical protein
MAAQKKTFPTIIVNGRVARSRNPEGKGYKGFFQVAVHQSAFEGVEGKTPFFRTKKNGGIWENPLGQLYVAEFRMPNGMPKEALKALNEGRGKNDDGSTNDTVEITFTGDFVTSVRVFIDGETGFDLSCSSQTRRKKKKPQTEKSES